MNKMDRYHRSDKDSKSITYSGIDYFFIVDEERILMRRADGKDPTDNEVRTITNYIKYEGWADHLLDEEDDI